MLTELEKTNIRSSMKDWTVQVLRRNAYPILFIAMPKNADGKDVLLWKGGQYSNSQIRRFLLYLLESFPEEG